MPSYDSSQDHHKLSRVLHAFPLLEVFWTAVHVCAVVFGPSVILVHKLSYSASSVCQELRRLWSIIPSIFDTPKNSFSTVNLARYVAVKLEI